MKTPKKAIRPNEAGVFGELAARPNPHGLIIVNEPPLDVKLTAMAFRLRRALTWKEIEAECTKAPSIALTRRAAEDTFAARARRWEC